MRVPEFKEKFGTNADEDLIGSDTRDRLRPMTAKTGSTPWAAMTSYMAEQEAICWTAERVPTSCLGGLATITTGLRTLPMS